MPYRHLLLVSVVGEEYQLIMPDRSHRTRMSRASKRKITARVPTTSTDRLCLSSPARPPHRHPPRKTNNRPPTPPTPSWTVRLVARVGYMVDSLLHVLRSSSSPFHSAACACCRLVFGVCLFALFSVVCCAAVRVTLCWVPIQASLVWYCSVRPRQWVVAIVAGQAKEY